ncbi:bifunctional folylpolyglutamate synthase/dihydrofolate synthase [Agaricicola taiwanensis]|uniref:Dihydrofolate synthase/folylpolyglutamate synthase n=1 Tax=Agaricicola taiwanensis TaxID=591372 RepID=A0A8J2VMH9_9RHOB|nr:folylpolyglutamate synthase/dihydrofolate synthase family protein [Agaricicola taiwanensis]GGE32668.1 bifunctional folylpolyglutamate synthase/dihydrofolate synthase [Agaricicola taiwanensis]
MKSSDAILARLVALHPREIDLSLGRIERLLAALGHPEQSLPPVIHVAGTNGKGSTIAFLRAMLEAEGKGVHVYISPHLVHFHERIRLAAPGGGQLVSETELAEALAYVEEVNAGAPITLFEITTAAAFLLFARHPADVLLLEVGLGGRLDATNVVAKPLASVITPISLDHAKFLGNRVTEIAWEKAGILKKDVPAIIAVQGNEARDVLERAAARTGSPILISGQDWQAREERGRLVFEDESGLLDLPLPRLQGRHQHENAGAAIATLRALPQLGVTAGSVERGLQTVEWPARMQRLTKGALVEGLKEGIEIWLDGGHNADGGRVISEAMTALEERVSCPLILIVGMLNTKDSEGFLNSFASIASELHAVPIASSDASRTPEEVAQAAARAGIPALPHASLQEAVAAVLRQSESPARVLITGSLYLAGEVLALNGTPPQ